ncbi:MAG: site-specific DNA-methyltransferase [bacterium]
MDGRRLRQFKPGGIIIVFYDLWKLESLARLLTHLGFRMLRFLEWLKTNPVPINSKRFYLSNAREVAIAAVKGSNPIFNAEYHNGLFTMPIHREKRIHPTQKPLALMKQLIEIHTDPGDIVLDPFAGSATTLLASIQLDRRAIGCELNPEYYSAALQRLNGALLQTNIRRFQTQASVPMGRGKNSII